MSTVSPQSIVKKAVELYKAEETIDMVKMAMELDVEVYAKEEPEAFNSEISYDRTSDKYFIIVNANHSLVRQRFSIAHAVAHYTLQPEQIKKKGYVNRDDATVVDKKIEEQADNLAAEILVPEELVMDYCRKNKIDKNKKIVEEVINSIADYFKVSRVIAIERMRQLTFYVPYISFS